MFGFVKNWLRKTSAMETSSNQPVYTPEEEAGYETPVGADTDYSGEEEVAAAEFPTERPEDYLQLPLTSVFNVLPADLQSMVRLPVNGEAQISVPLALILPQLGRGSVRLSFGELRSMTDEDIFHSHSDRDQSVVELPLGEILARVNPSSLQRRAQRQLEVSEEITSPFESKGEGLNVYKPEPAPKQAFVRKVDESTAVPEFPARGTIASVPPLFHSNKPTPTPTNAPIRVMVQKDPPPATHMLVQAAAHSGNGNGSTLTVSLDQLAEAWPDSIRQEVIQMGLAGTNVALPMSFAEESLRKGRAIAPWQQVRAWTNHPKAGSVRSASDAELLDLPLKVIAPIFLAKLRSNQSAKKSDVDTKIPNVFSPKPAGQAPAPVASAPTPPLAQPIPMPAAGSFDTATFRPMMNYAEARGKARQSNTELVVRSSTDFLKRFATPNDIVAKAGGLEGVEGALITLSDGLLVASHLHGTVNGDTLAAFIPQLFGRANQSTREFRMGELSQLSLVVGGTPWVIFKGGSVFFAAFGRSNEALPLESLKSLAAELDRKKQP